MFGVAGGCKGEDLTNVKIDHVTDYGTEVIVNIPETKTKKTPKVFVISGEFAKIVQKYMQLRPQKLTTDRFFLQYQQGECQCQVLGKNKIAIVPKEIAKFLKLDDYKSYTGHSFRPTVLLNSGIETIKHRRWESIKMAKKKTDAFIQSIASNQLATSTKTNTNVDNRLAVSKRQKAVSAGASFDSYYGIMSEPQVSVEPIMPMLPSTTSLMKRKSKYYMGLQPDRFAHLLQLAGQRKQLSDVKFMLTLRKLRLNEEFEVLGDAFDLDKATAEQYYHESKHIVIDIVDLESTTPHSSNNFEVVAEPVIKIEVCDTPFVPDPIAVEPSSDYESTTEMNAADDPDEFEIDWPAVTDDDRGFLSDDIRKRTAECSVCHKFYAPRRLNSHMESVHFKQTNLNRTICGLCWKECDSVTLLKTHQKDAHGGGSYGCDVCGRIFSSKRYISAHILDKHAQLKTFLCHTCGEGFPVPFLLNEHVKRKHEQRSHDCHVCDRKFVTAMALKDHICAIHTNQRPYRCEVEGCGKTFNWPSCFKSHKRVHAEDKYECSVCLSRFSFKANLRNHLKTIHNQIVDNGCLSSKFFTK